MTKTLDRRDTFVVSSKTGVGDHVTRTVTLPGGRKVHVLDREIFDRAVKAASPPLEKKTSDSRK
jgi:hypothetical protein